MAKKKVLVVGAGAAGMSCADSLANHPDKFDVTLIDSVDYCGGQAFSIPLDKEKHGASWLNQGVQGGSDIFKHTFYQFRKQGHDVTPVELQVSFGQDDFFWSNLFPTHLIEKHQSEIKRFVKTIRLLRWFEVFIMLVPIQTLLKMLFFSDDFINYMILPMVALFLGTGNATPYVPAIILERLFTSPTYGMWYPGDTTRLASNLPPMVVFPEFSKFYGDWANDLRSKGVKIRLSTELTEVVHRDKKGVKVILKHRANNKKDLSARDGFQANGHADLPNGQAGHFDSQDMPEEYDQLVLCVLADTAKRILGRTATWSEKRVLGAAKFSDDITVTHYDTDYMEKRYVNHFTPDRAVSNIKGKDYSEDIQKAPKDFKPMYYIIPQNIDEGQDPAKVDMCFDCSNYQAQFPKDLPFEKHVFQTIFLNKKDEKFWTRDGIDKSKIIREDWWHQLEHSWTHYAFVVPWMWLLNGTKSTQYAGSWSLVNAHETAIISGMSAAYSLGASYPEELEQDKLAILSFRLFNLLTRFKWYKRGQNRERK